MGDDKLTYFGFSYGTYLGATYASLFPTRYRAMVLDGPVDAGLVRQPPTVACASSRRASNAPSAGSSQACAANQAVCGFGGDDPWSASTSSSTTANMHPIPRRRPPTRGR